LIDTAEFRVLKGFVESGNEVHVLMPTENEIQGDYWHEGMNIHEFKNITPPFQTSNFVSRILSMLAQYAQLFLFLFFSLKKFSATVKDCGKPDLVYGYMPPASIVAYIVSKLYDIPNITRLFGTFLYTSISSARNLILRMGWQELFAFRLPCLYLIITNDGTRGDETARRLGIPKEKVKYYMDGADFMTPVQGDRINSREKLGISKETRLLLSVCRLTKWKQVDRIIKAMPGITETNKNVRLFLVGEGEERKNLEFLCEQLGVKDFVVFLGAVAHNRIREFMLVSDIFVSLYDFTNLTNSTFEAMNCGLCIVALNTGATSQVIRDGVNGVLLDPLHLKRLPDVINMLLMEDDRRKKLGQNGRQYALENFKTWEERIAAEVDLIMESLS
jgi:glycosyltransferase involved in cell wall biosynthesis